MIDYESLLDRVRQNPYEHLGRCSVSEIYPYFIGYDIARKNWGLSEIHYQFDRDEFRDWIESKVHLCNKNLQTFCLLMTETEKEAFNLYFEFYDLAIEECKVNLTINKEISDAEFNLNISEKSATLVDFILNEEFRKRPAMYFGNHRKVSGLWAMCNGFLWAEKDLGIEDSSDAINLEMFQLWIDERYPIAKGKPWDKIFFYNALNSDDRALKEFYDHFEMFLEGKKSDAPPRWVEIAIESIKKNEKLDENQ